MKIALASDHAGYKYKSMLAEWLQSKGHEVTDFGTDFGTDFVTDSVTVSNISPNF